MALRKTAEEKELAARQLAVQRQAAQQQKVADDLAKQRAAFLRTPVGQAQAAKEAGQGFFEVQLVVGASQRDSTFFGTNNTAVIKKNTTATHAGTLAGIEAAGWRLEHVGYVFMVTNESSRDKFLSSGQQVAVSGQTIGIYLFRNSDAA